MLRHIKPGMLLFSILCIVLGLSLLVAPQAVSSVLCVALGALVLLSGLEDLTRYFKKDVTGPRAVLCLLLGLPTVAVGVLALVRGWEAADSIDWILPLLFGLILILDGLVRFQSAFELCRRKGQKWWVVLLLGAVSIIFGALLAVSQLMSFSGLNLMLLSGILVLAEGILNLCCSIYIAMEFHALDRLDAAHAEKPEGEEAPADVSAPEQEEPAGEESEISVPSPDSQEAPAEEPDSAELPDTQTDPKLTL